MRINDARDELFTALGGAGLVAIGWERKNFVPPVAIVVPAEPFIDTDGETTFTEPFAVHYVVQLVAGRGTGDTVQDKLAEMIEAATLALHGIGMSIDAVEYPLISGEDEKLTIGAQVVVTATINLKEDV